MSGLLRKVIQNEAERIAKEAGFTTLPVCPFKIAADADIAVEAKPAKADGVSGMLVRAGDRFGILYATHIKSPGFQRFSISHELGHYYLEGHVEAVLKNGAHASHAGFVSADRYEREADQFAAALLMPEGAFRSAMRGSGTGMRVIERLSALAETSLPATAFRYHELTKEAVAVILSTGSVVDVCFCSDSFKDFKPSFIKKGSPVPHGTLTRQFNDDESKVLGGTSEEDQTNFSDWFGGRGPALREEVKGLGSYGKTLTIVSCATKAEDDYDPFDEAEDETYLQERWTPRFHR